MICLCLSVSDELIQSIILNSSWLGPCKSLCAYISSEDLREVDTSRILSQVISNLGTLINTVSDLFHLVKKL